MIGIQLQGRLGNQMFQYATARTLAEGIGCTLMLAGNTVGRRFGLVGHWLGFDEMPEMPGSQQNGLLRAAFKRGPSFWRGRVVELSSPWLKRLFFPHQFAPRQTVLRGRTYEEFDDSIFGQTSGTWIDGWFQSEKYFASNADRVRHWFQPSLRCSRQLNELMLQWPSSPENMVAIHVRRGDYVALDDNSSLLQQGWLLPMRYYLDALDCIPKHVGIAIFSDDPDWAAQQFSHRHPWVSRGESAVLDMFSIASCRWKIIANSSFSWWGAWLNRHPNEVVLAPKHHLGWRVGTWIPGGIEVAGWNYLEVHG